MIRPDHDDLRALLAVVRERSFTRAAAQLGTSQSALSRTIAGLEAQIGVRLLNRTTRAVAPTPEGERLAQGVAPHFAAIDAAVDALGESLARPSGLVRLTVDEGSAETVVWPGLRRILHAWPEISVEVLVDNGLVDIVAAGLDAGVRSGDILARDMVAVPIGPDLRMVVVATPAFCAGRDLPRHPRDLAAHPCINFRLPTRGGIYAWEFSRGREALRMRVEGPLTVNTLALAAQAMRDDLGFAFLPESGVTADIAAGRLIQVLDDWCEPYPGYHLYYPSRAHVSPALRVVIDGLRWLPAHSVSTAGGRTP